MEAGPPTRVKLPASVSVQQFAGGRVKWNISVPFNIDQFSYVKKEKSVVTDRRLINIFIPSFPKDL